MAFVVVRDEWCTPENRQVIKWWELRRIPYTLIIGVVGVWSYFVGNSIIELYAPRGEEFVKPAFVLVGVPFLVLVANVIYTFGWLTELAVRKRRNKESRHFRAIAFYSGVAFSVLVMSLPVWVALLDLIWPRP